ncbi:OLC1v1002544C1 [Oldenlandia corymbosa var. corymbosa]|uniref:OLC1v1002544C1 n=1 Tax=Oldenlandia corymbosa var. corymbosa TaxID=529605 RepID=A0AAV1DBA1_OLDCO|nr:OLC1v1002544C1 [Oldenlandia corymbosa var. corymbosa]
MAMGMGARLWNMVPGLKATMMMITVQVSIAGVNVFYKLASDNGMSVRIIVAYRYLFGSAAVLPLALFFDRNHRTKLTWMVTIQAFICALFGGTIAQNLYAQGLVMTSATFASTATNLVPALTFLMAAIFRLEKFDLKSKAGKAKVIGTLICISGAMILTYYRGVEIKLWPTTKSDKHGSEDAHSQTSHDRKTSDHIVGSMFLITSAFCSAFSLIFRTKMSKRYPHHYSSTALICLMGSFQSVIFALCMENKHWDEWKMGWNIRLLAVAYSGIVVTGLMVVIIMWCVRLRGPLFVSIFSPLTLVLVAFAGTLFLNEKLYLGSVLGAVVIVCGLYSVLWGNAKDVNNKPISQNSEYDDGDDREIEMPKMARNGEDVDKKGNLVVAVEIAPNLPTVPGISSSSTSYHEEEERPKRAGIA